MRAVPKISMSALSASDRGTRGSRGTRLNPELERSTIERPLIAMAIVDVGGARENLHNLLAGYPLTNSSHLAKLGSSSQMWLNMKTTSRNHQPNCYRLQMQHSILPMEMAILKAVLIFSTYLSKMSLVGQNAPQRAVPLWLGICETL